MNFPIAALAFMAVATAAVPEKPPTSAERLVFAINHADSGAVPYRHAPLSLSDVRSLRCISPGEEPTEVRCAWRQRTRKG